MIEWAIGLAFDLMIRVDVWSLRWRLQLTCLRVCVLMLVFALGVRVAVLDCKGLGVWLDVDWVLESGNNLSKLFGLVCVDADWFFDWAFELVLIWSLSQSVTW